MNKLTTINTIKKAAPLALLAVVMSGSAFAGPGENNGKKKENRPTGSKISLDLVNICTLNTSDPRILDLKVSIADVSGTEPGDGAGTAMFPPTAQASVKKSGPVFTPVGPVKPLSNAVGDGYWRVSLNLCDGDENDDALVENAKAANSVVSIDVLNSNGETTTFSTMCDNPYTDDNYDDQDDMDESDISIGHLGISCPDVP